MPRIVKLVTGLLETNTYILISGSGDCIVIDPGECIPEERLREAGCQRVEVVAATHMHIDHVAGVKCLRRLGAAYAANPSDHPALEYSLRLARIWGIEPPEPPGEPDIPLHDQTRIHVGDVLLEAVHTPGHTPGHTAFMLVGGHAVFTGDLLFAGAVGRTDFPGSSYTQLLQSLRRLYTLLPPDTLVLPGHGPETTLAREKQNNPFVREALRQELGGDD